MQIASEKLDELDLGRYKNYNENISKQFKCKNHAIEIKTHMEYLDPNSSGLNINIDY